MAMVVGGKRQKGVGPSYVPAVVLDQMAQRLVPIIRDSVVTAVKSGGGSNARRLNPTGRKAKAGRRGQQQVAGGGTSNPSQNTFSIGKSISLQNADRMHVVQRDLVSMNNSTTSGVLSVGYTLGLATSLSTANVYSLGSQVPRLVTMAGLYREFVLNSVELRWIPNQGYTAAGTVSMGIDPSPQAGAPSGMSSVIHHSCSKLFDLKAEQSIQWKPRVGAKTGYRYTTALTGTDEDGLSFGVAQIYSTNGFAAGANVGNLLITADITFIGAM